MQAPYKPNLEKVLEELGGLDKTFMTSANLKDSTEINEISAKKFKRWF